VWKPPSCLTAKLPLDNTAGTAGKRFSELGQALAKNTTRLLSAWLRLASGSLTTRAPGDEIIHGRHHHTQRMPYAQQQTQKY